MQFIPGPEECENVEGYEEGGFHPVLIGDKFCDDRYSVIHKLGAGGYATVWLVRDHVESRYAALKILTADSSADSDELKMYQYLQKDGAAEYDKCRVVPLFDSFWSESVNGRHLCLAFEVMGPSLASFQQGEMKKLRPDVVRKMASETAQGLSELHERGVVIGDLSAANILLRLDDISQWSAEELYEKLGHPERIDMREAGEPDDSGFYKGKPCEDTHAPKSLIMPVNFSELPHELFRPEARFIDLGEAYLSESIREGFAVNFSYADPESVWWSQTPTQASDVWALACVWFEMRAADPIFSQGFGGPAEVKTEIIKTLGALPAPWIETLRREWAEKQALRETDQSDEGADLEAAYRGRSSDTPNLLIRFKSFWTWLKCRLLKKSSSGDDRGRVSRHTPPKDDDKADAAEEEEAEEVLHESLAHKIQQIGKWKPWCYLTVEERRQKIQVFKQGMELEAPHIEADTGNPPPGPLSAEEAADFRGLLLSMLTYKRVDRAGIKELLDHAWLNKDYGPENSEPWLQQFHPGTTLEIDDEETGAPVRLT